uniref:Uncharacterized protein n=1 Tax=Arundo donax TaxID=35708 RepID=A0A0A9ABD5_ARUDO
MGLIWSISLCSYLKGIDNDLYCCFPFVC